MENRCGAGRPDHGTAERHDRENLADDVVDYVARALKKVRGEKQDAKSALQNSPED
jgi:hypothetical protein